MLALTADRSLDELPDPDIVLIPGGEGNRPLLGDEEVLDWVRQAHQGSTWTTSVCTGSLVLGAAGILDGKRATSHWAYVEFLRAFGAEPVNERFVEDGKVITAAGVSAGIDMSLHLARQVAARRGGARRSSSRSSTTPTRRSTPGRPSRAPDEMVEGVRRLAQTDPSLRIVQ